MYGVWLASHVVNGHGVFFPGPSTVFTHHPWVGRKLHPKGWNFGRSGFPGFPSYSLTSSPQWFDLVKHKLKRIATHLKHGESSISHAHTFNNLPVLYINTHLDMYKYKYTWFVTSLCFITSLSTGCRHATMGAVDDFDFASVATVIGRSANQGGSSFASSPLKGDDFYTGSWD